MIKCTVAIPVYNRIVLVGQAVDSALAQDIDDMEILIVDNCSTDGTWELLQKYQDPRIRLIRNEINIGLFPNFNRCLESAQGEYLRFLCSDDVLVENCLSKEIEIMEQNQAVSILSSKGELVDQYGKAKWPELGQFSPGIYPGVQATRVFFQFLSHYAHNPFNYPSGILFRTDHARRAGEFNPEMKMTGDIDFFLRILEKGDFAMVEWHGCSVRVHVDQEGAYLFGDTSVFDELFSLWGKYEHLFNREESQSIKNLLAAYIAGRSIQLMSKGRWKAAQTHLKMALRHSSFLKILLGLMKISINRFILRIFNYKKFCCAPGALVDVK